VTDRLAGILSRIPAGVPDEERRLIAGALADMQTKVAAALALYVQGDGAAAAAMLGETSNLAVLAAFGAAAEMLNAAIGDDPTRGYAALATLHERSAEFAAAHQELIARPTGGNAS
jgi:hypothetical protein